MGDDFRLFVAAVIAGGCVIAGITGLLVAWEQGAGTEPAEQPAED